MAGVGRVSGDGAAVFGAADGTVCSRAWRGHHLRAARPGPVGRGCDQPGRDVRGCGGVERQGIENSDRLLAFGASGGEYSDGEFVGESELSISEGRVAANDFRVY